MSDPIFFAPLRVPLTDERTGLMSREWYLFFQAMFMRIGGTQAFSAEDLQLVDDMNDATHDVGTASAEALLTDEPLSANSDAVELLALSASFSDDPILPAALAGANPTASVGLAVINGAATTFMRSDAAPPISQSIAPTWTAKHIHQVEGQNVVVKGDLSFLDIQNAAGTSALQIATVKGWVGSGSNTTEGAVGAITTLNLYGSSAATPTVSMTGTTLGFFNATKIAKPTVTGSRGANVALASLLTALANFGLLTDSSTP